MRQNARPGMSASLASRPEHRERVMQVENQDSSMKLKLVLAWGFVGIPLLWGVLQTLSNAMKLFQ
jgi:hypothetical protein